MDLQHQEKIKHVVFTINNEKYCLKITSVKEVMEMPHLTEVPNSPVFVVGVVNLRGVVLTVIDGVDYFEGSKFENTEHTRILVFEDEHTGVLVGILVDNVYEVISIARNEIQSFVKDKGAKPYIKGLYHTESDVYIVLNEHRLFDTSDSVVVTDAS